MQPTLLRAVPPPTELWAMSSSGEHQMKELALWKEEGSLFTAQLSLEGTGGLRAAGRQQLDSYPFVTLGNRLFKSTALSLPPSVFPSIHVLFPQMGTCNQQLKWGEPCGSKP